MLNKMLTFWGSLIIAHILFGVTHTMSLTAVPAGGAVEIGKSITLRCEYSSGPSTLISLKWFRDLNGQEELIWSNTGSMALGANRRETYFSDDINKEHSLRIDDVTTSEQATYGCSIIMLDGNSPKFDKTNIELQVLVPPMKIELSVSPQLLKAGTSADITCVIRQVWPVAGMTVELTKGRDIVERGTSLPGLQVPGDPLARTVVLRSSAEITKHDHLVLVKCLVTWRGTTFTRAQDLKVYYPPSSLFLQKQPPEPLEEGADVQITCSHSGANPLPTLTLLRHNNNGDDDDASAVVVATANETVNVGFAVERLNRMQNGVRFSCQAVGGALDAGSVLRAPESVKLDVEFSTASLSMTEFPRSMVQEDIVTYITCVTGSANPTPEVVWEQSSELFRDTQKLNETQLPGKYSAFRRRSSYAVTPYRALNLLMYRCSLKDDPAVSRNVTLHVKFEALLVTHGPVPPTPAGSNLTLHCNSLTSNPSTTFDWKLAGGGGGGGAATVLDDVMTTQTPDTYHGMSANSSVRLASVTSELHAARVECTPSWDGKMLGEKTQSMVLNVTYPPSVTARISSTTTAPIFENSQLLLECIVSGHGNPQVYIYFWYYGEEGEESGPLLLEGEHLSTLRIPSVHAENAGIYWCHAMNHGGNSERASVRVRVSYIPREVAESASNVVYAMLDQQVQLNLTVRTYPAPTSCTWALKQPDSNIINMQQDIVHLQQSGSNLHVCSLLVPPVSRISYGTYTATVINIAGQLDVSFLIKPYGPPGPPIGVKVTPVPNQEHFTLTWFSGQNGGYPQMFSVFLRTVKKNSPNDENSHGEEKSGKSENWILSGGGIKDPGYSIQIVHYVDVTGQEFTEYEFLITSTNQLGKADSDVIAGQTVTVPTFEGNFTRSDGDTTIVRWSPIVDGSYDRSYDSILLRHCAPVGEEEECRDYNVTGREEWTLEGVAVADEDTLRLVAVHDDREMAASGSFVRVTASGVNAGSPGSSMAGVLGGVIAAIVILVLVIAVVFILAKRRRKQKAGTDAPEVSSHSGSYIALPSNNASAAVDHPYDEVVLRNPRNLPDENGDSSFDRPDIVSSHTRPQPAPRRKREDDTEDWTPKGLVVSGKPAPQRKRQDDSEDWTPKGLSVSIPPTSPRGTEAKYENEPSPSEPLYDNVNVRRGMEQSPDSVIYAKLDLPRLAEGETPLIHGDADKTEYVAIDFNKAPLPPDMDSD